DETVPFPGRSQERGAAAYARARGLVPSQGILGPWPTPASTLLVEDSARPKACARSPASPERGAKGGEIRRVGEARPAGPLLPPPMGYAQQEAQPSDVPEALSLEPLALIQRSTDPGYSSCAKGETKVICALTVEGSFYEPDFRVYTKMPEGELKTGHGLHPPVAKSDFHLRVGSGRGQFWEFDEELVPFFCEESVSVPIRKAREALTPRDFANAFHRLWSDCLTPHNAQGLRREKLPALPEQPAAEAEHPPSPTPATTEGCEEATSEGEDDWLEGLDVEAFQDPQYLMAALTHIAEAPTARHLGPLDFE
ncbi:unnamed protein product, partial [Prorocentrum cordatum]